jgi:hypothetical protein
MAPNAISKSRGISAEGQDEPDLQVRSAIMSESFTDRAQSALAGSRP